MLEYVPASGAPPGITCTKPAPALCVAVTFTTTAAAPDGTPPEPVICTRVVDPAAGFGAG